MKSINKIPLAIMLASIIGPLTSNAQDMPGEANWRNTSAGQYWKNSTGQCWRSSTWTPAEATPECDPDLFKKAEAPAPKIAEAPPPEPTRIVPQKVSFSSEDLFDFNKTELKADGKAKLDKLADELKDARYDTIMATGHADRIGNKSYNQKLSEQRAESVRAYLVSKGIPSDRIRAEGKGESEPITAASQCQGMKTAELASCLQADRRVEVQVNATKDVVVRPAS
ncbi:MAG: OmpA family protein [Burkholderiaceae bacterium]